MSGLAIGRCFTPPLLAQTRGNYGACRAAGKAIFGGWVLNCRAAGCTGLAQRQDWLHPLCIFTLRLPCFVVKTLSTRLSDGHIAGLFR